jgi:hypothetical protein
LPVRDALKTPNTAEIEENYVIALIGDIPGVGVPSDDDDPAERQRKLNIIKETTRLERKDDPLELRYPYYYGYDPYYYGYDPLHLRYLSTVFGAGAGPSTELRMA